MPLTSGDRQHWIMQRFGAPQTLLFTTSSEEPPSLQPYLSPSPYKLSSLPLRRHSPLLAPVMTFQAPQGPHWMAQSFPPHPVIAFPHPPVVVSLPPPANAFFPHI
mmetsp:Transcript_6322/g.12528  ORF Transcript_6322/g.12528 Transcript_6322/m.12528 type:complete len:105 (+) Transcript_6322:1577-1891(+)